MSEDVRTALALSHLPRVGRVRLREMLVRLTSTGNDELTLSDALTRLQLSGFSAAHLDSAIGRADELIEQCRSLGVTVYTFGSPAYPSQLNRLSDPPALLFAVGQFDPRRKPRVAVIGTRKPTPWGIKTAKACAERIAEAHGVVVSGLALGIDTAAQAASVSHCATTWSVLAHGLHTVSPSSNRELAKKIVEGGALISEYPPGEPARRHYFVERDRIQAGLADAVLVIESGINGGSMHTVRFARQVAVPVWVTFPNAKVGTARHDDLPESQQGTWELIRNRTATRVATVKALDKMIRDLARLEHRPDTLFSK